jgi:hypothetical protein
MCSQTGLGRLEKRIFGNGVLPEDRPNQVLPRFVLALGIGLRDEPPITRIESSERCRLRLHSALRKHDQGTANTPNGLFSRRSNVWRQKTRSCP